MKNKCKCIDIPPNTTFIVGNIYEWDWLIDGIEVINTNGEIFSFSEIEFHWYFAKMKD